MGFSRILIIGLIAAALEAFATAQSAAAPPPTENLSGQDQSVQASGIENPETARTAPAAAVTAIGGLQDDGNVEDMNLELPQIPSFLGGAGMSGVLVSEMERSNFLHGGVNVGAAYDDNPLLIANGESNTSETIFPNISIVESTSRTRWSLAYAGGLTINQKITTQNEGSQNLTFDSQFRLSPHLNLRIAENFSITTGFFDSGNGEQLVPVSGGPNASLLAPLSTQRSTSTTVETSYHLALNDLVGASGSFYSLNFTNVPAGAALTSSETAAVTAFWLHRIYRGNWAGLSYRFQRITFDPAGETRTHTFALIDTLKLANGFSMNAFAGPEYVDNQGLVPGGGSEPSQSNFWMVAGGIEGGWQSLRTSLTAGYSQTTSDGGGILGVVRLENVHANFRRELVQGWAVNLMASHGINHALTVPYADAATSINLTSAGVSLERNMNKSFGLRLGYTHDFQQQFGLPAPNPNLDAHRNRAFVTLSYQWAKPLGM